MSAPVAVAAVRVAAAASAAAAAVAAVSVAAAAAVASVAVAAAALVARSPRPRHPNETARARCPGRFLCILRGGKPPRGKASGRADSRAAAVVRLDLGDPDCADAALADSSVPPPERARVAGLNRLHRDEIKPVPHRAALCYHCVFIRTRRRKCWTRLTTKMFRRARARQRSAGPGFLDQLPDGLRPRHHAGAGFREHGACAALRVRVHAGAREPLLSNYIDYAALKGRPVLEIGFGTGWLMNELVRAGAEGARHRPQPEPRRTVQASLS